MFEVLDADGSGFIDREEFLSGIIQLSDVITPLSILELHGIVCQNAQVCRRMESHVGCLFDTVSVMQQQIATLLDILRNTEVGLGGDGNGHESALGRSSIVAEQPGHFMPHRRLSAHRPAKPPAELVMPVLQKVQEDLSTMMSRIETSHSQVLEKAASTAEQHFELG